MLEDALLNMINAAYPPELKILNATARARVRAAIKAQCYYNGDFWRFIDAEQGQWNEEVGVHEQKRDYPGAKGNKDAGLSYAPSRLALRYPKFFVDEVASWMFEKAVTLDGDVEPRKRVMAVHKANMLDEKLLQGAGESCLTGGVAVKILWNETLGKTRVLIRPSRECFPIYDPDDIDLLQKVYFCSFQDDEKTLWRQTFEIVDGTSDGFKGPVCRVIEELFKIDELKNKNPRPFKLLRNELLFKDGNAIDFIPVVPVPNEPNLGEIWGESDLESLYTEINEICRKTSDFGDMLGYEMFPLSVFKNVEWDQTHPPQAKPGAFIEINGPNDAQPEAYKLESQMSAKVSVEFYIDQMINLAHQFSGVPNITRDKLDSLGTMSGVAVRLMYLGIISKCDRKMKYWIPRLGNVYDMILKTEGVYSDYTYAEGYELTIETHSKLPQNELEEAQIIAIKLNQLMASIKTQMKKDGVVDVDAEFAQMLIERQQIAEAENPDVIGSAINREALNTPVGPNDQRR